MENTEDTIASNGSEPAESGSKAIEINVGDKGKKPIESKKSEKRGRGSHYPVRCCEPNCGFFVRSGYCRYGSACRFNHPRRRAGRSWTGSRSSQHYFMPGGCRYGNACKFAHYAERTNLEPITSSLFSFPVQPEELGCPEYICTGYCTFSGICKFQHPPFPTSFPNLQEFSEYFSERLRLSGCENCGFGNFDPRHLNLQRDLNHDKPQMSHCLPLIFSNLTRHQSFHFKLTIIAGVRLYSGIQQQQMHHLHPSKMSETPRLHL